MGTLLFLLFLVAFYSSALITYIHGIMLSFRKAWYVGLAAVVCPLFAQVVSIAKLCGKDLLK